MTSFANFAHQAPLVLTIPGLGNSGAGHWQTIWEETRADCERVDLGMWDRPHRNSWVTKLNAAIRQADRPVILAAHSLGCLAVAWWAALERQPFGAPVAGALLVAPPEVDIASTDGRLAAFGPAPKVLLPFPSIVAASRNDPYISFNRAHSLASFWGSHCVDAGEVGHINAESGLGEWSYGQYLLNHLIGIATDGVGAQSPTTQAITRTQTARDNVVGFRRDLTL